jgi:hypothetical protein
MDQVGVAVGVVVLVDNNVVLAELIVLPPSINASMKDGVTADKSTQAA